MNRRGFFLMELFVGLALAALVFTAGSVLLSRTLRASRAATATADRATIFDDMTAALRRDMLTATGFRAGPGVLRIGDITWTASSNSVIRKAGAAERSYAIAGVSLASAPGGVLLELGDAKTDRHNAVSIAIVCPAIWAKETR